MTTAKTIVITGGTDGMGRALASTYLDRGDTVVVIGRNAAKAAILPGAHFIPADLSLAGENRRVLKEINARYPVVDALVLCARYFRSSRFVTAAALKRHGAPVGEGIKPIIARIDAPPAEPLSAFMRFNPIALNEPSFAPGDAERLDDLTRHLLRSQEK